jgi:hypothetical protein
MNQFTVNSLISRETSTITGSLTVLGTIDTIIGTASLAQTSSQTQQTATASFSTVTLVQTSSYAQTSISSSYALTASFVEDKGIGINSISWLSPNTMLGNYNFQYAKNSNVAGLVGQAVGGVMFSPIQIKKTCTCATMSMAFVGTIGAGSCYLGIYTNSSNNLPEFRIFHGETAKSVSTNVYQNYFVTQSAVTLNQNETYWVALSLSGSGPITTILSNNATVSNVYIYNELLGSRLNIINALSEFVWNISQISIIRSGSTNINIDTYLLPTTCSQDITQYNIGLSTSTTDNITRYPIRMPFLKVEYT